MVTRANRFAFDAELFIRPETAPAATAAGNGVWYDLGASTAEYNEGLIGCKQEFVAVVRVRNFAAAATVSLVVANEDESETATFSATEVTGNGEYILPIVREQIETVDGAVKLTVAHDGALDYFAFLAPIYGVAH